MANESVLGNAIGFLDKLGVYEYLLPFILVFTILYAIFEKTKVLGTETINSVVYPRRNLNAMASFVMALLVIVSDKVVGIIVETSTNIVVLIMASIFFMIMVGSFQKENEKPFFLTGKWKDAFMWIMSIGLFGIFLSALKTKEGDSWLSAILKGLGTPYMEDILSATILIVIIGVFITFVTKENNQEEKKGDE